MIRLFGRDETDFNHNETVLRDVKSAPVEEVANGMYEIVLEYPRNEFAKQLTEGKIIKAPTARGEQLFRIYKPIKNLDGYTIYARHIFYDLLTNFIEDIRPTKKGGDGAIKDILGATQINQGFRGFSDITKKATAYYTRKNPVEALLGASNSFANVWGGELIRDNHLVKMVARGGEDKGYEVRLGKNLIGVEVDTDESNIFTRIHPTVVIDEQNVTTLPEKYIDSPLIDHYEYPKIIEERIELTDAQKELPLAEIYTLMREYCADLFEQDVDKAKVNFKVDFIELSQTEQYKDLKILEELDLYDTVLAYVPELDINVTAKVIRTKYDSIRKRYISMELGNFKQNGATQAKNTIDRIDKTIKDERDLIINIIQDAADGKSRIFRGPDEPTEGMIEGDLWYKSMPKGEVELRQYDGEEWKFLVATGMNSEIDKAIKDAEKIAEDARKRADASQKDADSILTGLGVESITDVHTGIVSGIKTNVGDRITGFDTKYNRITGEITESITTVDEKLDKETGLINEIVIGIDSKIDTKTGEITESINKIKSSPTEELVGYNQTVENAEMFQRIIGSSGQSDGVLKSKVARLVMAEDIFQTEIKDVLTGNSTAVNQLNNSYAINIKSANDLVTQFNASDEGFLLQGKKIVLDADTTVDGSFTVTDTIFAENMSISKFTIGTLNAAEVNLINVNVDNIVGNYGNFIKISLKEANSSASLTGNRLRYEHSGSGNYSEMTANGFMRYDAGTGREYHHLTKIIKFSTTSGPNSQVNWIKLGSEFNHLSASDLRWAVSLTVADSMTAPLAYTIQRFVLTQGHANGKVVQPKKVGGQWEFPVTGYTVFNWNERPTQMRAINGLMIITA